MGPPPTSNQMVIIADIDNNRFAVLAAINDDNNEVNKDEMDRIDAASDGVKG